MGVVFAGVAVLVGLAVHRATRLPLSLAPVGGLAAIAVLSTWCAALSVPPLLRTGGVAVLAVCGLVIAAEELRVARYTFRVERGSLALLAFAVALPALMLGVAFAGVEAPVSTHDGAFHVETIDKLRAGIAVGGWYPLGFHASVAAVLGLAPWLDSARGTFEAAQGLAILAPLAVFGLGLALGMRPIIAAAAALVLGLTWTYPYDYHLWAGWPQGMGVLLLIGLLATAVCWSQRPSTRLALLGGLFAGAIVLTHGTEVYSAVLALLVIVVARVRVLKVGALTRQLPLAIGLAVLITAPYLGTLLGWAGTGGAIAAGETIAAGADVQGHGDWLQFALGVTGAASLIDLPLRVILIVLGLTAFRARLAGGVWAVFVALLLAADLVNPPLMTRVFAVTYPWLDHDRPRQVAVVFASLLVAGGLSVCASYALRWRARMALYPNAWRRLAIVTVVALGFFAEGSGVSIYKRLSQAIAEQNVYSADDAAAMDWLRRNAMSGEVVANDLSGDAGIWAPYKANVPILMPRSAEWATLESRESILKNVAELSRDPSLASEACALHVGYLFHGSPPQAFDERTFTDRRTLEQAPDLQEVFSSGEATIFRVKLACG